MEMREAIYKRKSIRKFDISPLNEETIAGVKRFAENAKPLYEGIKVKFEVISSVKGVFSVKAPHYILIYSEKKDGYLYNAGFILQQIDLYLQSTGLGSCWLGLAKPTEKIESAMEYIIMLAFGKPDEALYREISAFDRRSLSEVSDISDKNLEPARLAPSATNSQPWYFVSSSGATHIYCVKHGAVKAKFYERLNKIDIGIALAHLYVSYPAFDFFSSESPKQVPEHYYVGSVKI